MVVVYFVNFFCYTCCGVLIMNVQRVEEIEKRMD